MKEIYQRTIFILKFEAVLTCLTEHLLFNDFSPLPFPISFSLLHIDSVHLIKNCLPPLDFDLWKTEGKHFFFYLIQFFEFHNLSKDIFQYTPCIFWVSRKLIRYSQYVTTLPHIILDVFISTCTQKEHDILKVVMIKNLTYVNVLLYESTTKK